MAGHCQFWISKGSLHPAGGAVGAVCQASLVVTSLLEYLGGAATVNLDPAFEPSAPACRIDTPSSLIILKKPLLPPLSRRSPPAVYCSQGHGAC